jgi:hypothetical protein
MAFKSHTMYMDQPGSNEQQKILFYLPLQYSLSPILKCSSFARADFQKLKKYDLGFMCRFLKKKNSLFYQSRPNLKGTTRKPETI